MSESGRSCLWLGAALPLLASLASTPARAAAPITAEQALETYKHSFETGALIDCRRDEAGDEIVVCGRSGRPDPNRVPFPEQREPGERVRLLPGEPPSALAALNAGSTGCSAVGPNQSCGGGLDVFRVATVLVKAVKALTGGDD